MSSVRGATLVPARESVDPRVHLGSLGDLQRLGRRGRPRIRDLDQRIDAFRAVRRHARPGPGAPARAPARTRRDRAALVSGLVLRRRCSTTRISATTRSTPAASRCSCCCHAGARPSRGSARNCCASRSRPFAAGWMIGTTWRVYRFFLEDLFRQQEHVLDEAGERLLSLSSRLCGVPHDAYAALSTADARFPDDYVVERRAASRSATASIESCSRPAASRTIGVRPTTRSTTRTRPRSTPTRRSTTA